MTGVMPLPPVQNSTFAGGGSGSTNSPCGSARRTMVPGARPRTRCSDMKPSGMAFTVMVRCPAAGRCAEPPSSGEELIE